LSHGKANGRRRLAHRPDVGRVGRPVKRLRDLAPEHLVHRVVVGRPVDRDLGDVRRSLGDADRLERRRGKRPRTPGAGRCRGHCRECALACAEHAMGPRRVASWTPPADTPRQRSRAVSDVRECAADRKPGRGCQHGPSNSVWGRGAATGPTVARSHDPEARAVVLATARHRQAHRTKRTQWGAHASRRSIVCGKQSRSVLERRTRPDLRRLAVSARSL